MKGLMPHYPQPFREGAAKLQGTRCGQGSAALELPKKIGRMRRVKAHQSGRLYSLQSGWYHGSYTAFAPVLDGIVAVWRGKGRFSFPFLRLW